MNGPLLFTLKNTFIFRSVTRPSGAPGLVAGKGPHLYHCPVWAPFEAGGPEAQYRLPTPSYSPVYISITTFSETPKKCALIFSQIYIVSHTLLINIKSMRFFFWNYFFFLFRGVNYMQIYVCNIYVNICIKILHRNHKRN